MSKIILDQALRAKLNGLNEQMEICDESGKTLGHFLPVEVYRKLVVSKLQIPFSEAEIERRRRETDGCSLEEFWKRVEKA
jgi:hypothetical protein